MPIKRGLLRLAVVFSFCAVTTALDRTAIGPFKSVYALDLKDLTSQEVLQEHLMSVEQVSDLLAD